LTASDVSHRRGLIHRRFDRAATRIETAAEEVQLHNMRKIPLIENNLLGVQAGKRRIVLMNTVNRDPVDGRFGRLSKRLTPLDVSGIQQSGPVDDADHDRFACSQQNIADRFERIVDTNNRFDPTAAK